MLNSPSVGAVPVARYQFQRGGNMLPGGDTISVSRFHMDVTSRVNTATGSARTPPTSTAAAVCSAAKSEIVFDGEDDSIMAEKESEPSPGNPYLQLGMGPSGGSERALHAYPMQRNQEAIVPHGFGDVQLHVCGSVPPGFGNVGLELGEPSQPARPDRVVGGIDDVVFFWEGLLAGNYIPEEIVALERISDETEKLPEKHISATETNLSLADGAVDSQGDGSSTGSSNDTNILIDNTSQSDDDVVFLGDVNTMHERVDIASDRTTLSLAPPHDEGPLLLSGYIGAATPSSSACAKKKGKVEDDTSGRSVRNRVISIGNVDRAPNPPHSDDGYNSTSDDSIYGGWF